MCRVRGRAVLVGRWTAARRRAVGANRVTAGRITVIMAARISQAKSEQQTRIKFAGFCSFRAAGLPRPITRQPAWGPISCVSRSQEDFAYHEYAKSSRDLETGPTWHQIGLTSR